EVRLRLRRQLLKLGAPAAFILRQAIALGLRQAVLGELLDDLLELFLLGLQIAPALLTERLQLLSGALTEVRLRDDTLHTDDDRCRSCRSDLSRSQNDHDSAGGEHTYLFHDEYPSTFPLYRLGLPAEGERLRAVAEPVSA